MWVNDIPVEFNDHGQEINSRGGSRNGTNVEWAGVAASTVGSLTSTSVAENSIGPANADGSTIFSVVANADGVSNSAASYPLRNCRVGRILSRTSVVPPQWWFSYW